MNQRIRYGKSEDGNILTSRRVYLTQSGVSVKVELDLVNKSYKVNDAVTNQTLSAGAGTKNLNVLKSKAKMALEAMGVTFEPEDRAEKRKPVAGI